LALHGRAVDLLVSAFVLLEVNHAIV